MRARGIRIFFAFLLCIAALTGSALAFGPADLEIPDSAEAIVYGQSGAGRNLMAYRFGTGNNVMVLGFAIHGYEDNWSRDGGALVYTAGELMKDLDANMDLVNDYDWSIYVLPCMNPDGLLDGTSNNGPGRCTTTYLNQSGQLVTGTGIDMNRSFPVGWTAFTGSRNFNGSAPLACRESAALAQFVRDVKGSGRNICIDAHGWYSQIITSNGTSNDLYRIFHQAFPANTWSSCTSGKGYFTAYTASLGYTSCLFEFPDGIYSMSGFTKSGYCEKYCGCILDLAKAYGTLIPWKTVTVEVVGNGTVTGGGSYRSGETAVLTAVPAGGCSFAGWYDENGTLLEQETSYSFPATEDVTITARFAGWQKVDGVWYYITPEGQRATGWREIDGNWYLFGADGAMQTGWYQSGDAWYYLRSSGAMTIDWCRIDGEWYYFNSAGVMQTGWQKVRGSWYYLRSSGSMVTGWYKVDGSWYYMNDAGVMQTGWLEQDGIRYYLRSSGAMATGWYKVDGTWYYFNSSGAMQSGWKKLSGSWYYLDPDGRMVTGWYDVDGVRYYFEDSGAMKTGWLQLEGVWYYLNRSGCMAVGWYSLGDCRYYFDEAGRMQTGWLELDGQRYYLDENGRMVTGHQIIDGVEYDFGDDGVLIVEEPTEP